MSTQTVTHYIGDSLLLVPEWIFMDMGGGCPDGWGLYGEGERYALYNEQTGMTTLYRRPTPLDFWLLMRLVRDCLLQPDAD